MPVCKCKVEQEKTNMESEREGEGEEVLCKWKDGRRRRKVRKNATLTDEICERKDAAGDNPAFPALKLSKLRHFIFPLSVQGHDCNKICCLFTQPVI